MLLLIGVSQVFIVQILLYTQNKIRYNFAQNFEREH